MKIGALILAAGASTRLGSPKQLVTLGAETLLERAVRTARSAGCDPIIVVLGANADDIQAACSLGEAEILLNLGWQEGMGSSLRAGVDALAGRVETMVVLTCDQPAVTEGHLRRLIEASRESGGAVCSSYGGGRGVPACFPAQCFDELRLLGGDTGARRLIASAPAIELPDGEVDVDTVESLRLARERFG